jgi:hypothetical protein
MKDQVVLVTGGATDIGKATAPAKSSASMAASSSGPDFNRAARARSSRSGPDRRGIAERGSAARIVETRRRWIRHFQLRMVALRGMRGLTPSLACQDEVNSLVAGVVTLDELPYRAGPATGLK